MLLEITGQCERFAVALLAMRTTCLFHFIVFHLKQTKSKKGEQFQKPTKMNHLHNMYFRQVI